MSFNSPLDTLQYQIEEEERAMSGPILNGACKSFEDYKRMTGVLDGLKRVSRLIEEIKNPPKKTENAEDGATVQ